MDSEISLPEGPDTKKLELEEKVAQSLGASFIKKCLEDPFIVQSEGNRKIINEDHFAVALRQLGPQIDKFYEDTKGGVGNKLHPLLIPEDFPWDQRARTALRDSINILHKSGLIPLITLVDASKLAGPNNTFITTDLGAVESSSQETMVGGVYDDIAYRQYQNEDPLTRSGLPKDKQTRDKYLSIKISPDAIAGKASDIFTLAKNNNIDITEEEAMNLALISITSHEYGHAIDFAILLTGKETFEASREVVDTTYLNDLQGSSTHRNIHQELFARGISEFVQRKYLQDKLFLSHEQTEMVLDAIEGKVLYPKVEAIQALLELAPEMGYTSEKVYSLARSFRFYATKIAGERVAPFTPHFDLMLRYFAKPYSENQIAEIVSS